jgi:hypothetical protein
MLVEQRRWSPNDGWQVVRESAGIAPQVVLVFGSCARLETPALIEQVQRAYPGAHLVGCSTAGEILDDWVFEDSVCATALQFERTRLRVVARDLPSVGESAAVGEQLARALEGPALSHILLFSEGVRCDGAELLRGMHAVLGANVGITGGMAGDSVHYHRTLLVADGEVRSQRVVAVGLYGESLTVGYGTLGGWDAFGPSRLVTKSRASVVYEMDGEPALDVYQRYLGQHANTLPASALLFPLSMRTDGREGEIVRTVCAVDHDQRTLTFAGAVPQGAHLRLMKANVERLIDAASAAATVSTAQMDGTTVELALLVSCVGRKLLLRAYVDEEVECVRNVLGPEAAFVGFYSYGEIAPLTPGGPCELHNQTLTVTTFSER